MALKEIIYLCLISFIQAQTVKQNQSAIEDLEGYINSKMPTINQRYRLHYHVSGPVGWINDPNGFSFYKGEYHLFFQYYPYDTVQGDMHWGHVSSPDLVNWKQLPTALIPDEEQCFSGSAVIDGDTMILMYTGHIRTETEPHYNESQYLAFSKDGVTFEKYDGNPVLQASPNGNPDFRDPKAWKHESYWYVVLGSKTDDNRGRVLLYRSEDMINWEFLSVLAESEDPNVYMWECPDFFELDGKFVLLFSPQGMQAEGDRYKNVYQNGYIIGSFNYNTFSFIPEVGFQEIDYGHDFYAAQTTEHNNKRYLVSWFSMWEVPHPEAADGWAGAMTIVRELSIENSRIIMKPVPDMIKLRDALVASGDFKTNETLLFDKAVEIIIHGDLTRDKELQLEGTDGGNKTWIRWSASARTVTVDRGNDDFRRVEWMPFGSRSWRLYLDASSLELFCGEGETVFSSRVYPDGEWKITNLSPQSLNIEAYRLKRSIYYNSGGNTAVFNLILTILSLIVTNCYYF